MGLSLNEVAFRALEVINAHRLVIGAGRCVLASEHYARSRTRRMVVLLHWLDTSMRLCIYRILRWAGRVVNHLLVLRLLALS